MKSTESLADIATRLLGIARSSPLDHTGSAGCPSRKLSSSVSSTEDLAGGQAGGQHPLHHLPESDIVAKRDDAKNGTKPGADAMVRRLNAPSG